MVAGACGWRHRALPRIGTSTPTSRRSCRAATSSIDERFFAGGATTHRAYGLDLLGVRGDTLFLAPGHAGYSPIGGNGLLLFNLDYRFPIAGAFGGSSSSTRGNVWADWRDRLAISRPGPASARATSRPSARSASTSAGSSTGSGEPPYALFVNIGNPF